MLILARKKDEVIICRIPNHEDIRIMVTDIRNNKVVRLGIEASEEVVILREEIDNVSTSN